MCLGARNGRRENQAGIGPEPARANRPGGCGQHQARNVSGAARAGIEG